MPGILCIYHDPRLGLLQREMPGIPDRSEAEGDQSIPLDHIACVFIGPYMTVKAVWTIADIFNGLMAIPNLIALLALNGVVVAETKIP